MTAAALLGIAAALSVPNVAFSLMLASWIAGRRLASELLTDCEC